MNTVVGAVAGVWLGMVLAISFLEAPLKFRAPGVTLALGLEIGRIVFAALNRAEVVLALAVLLAVVLGPHPVGLVVAGAVACGTLVAQLVLARPFLVRRSNQVLKGEQGPRSRAHHVYVVLEVVPLRCCSRRQRERTCSFWDTVAAAFSSARCWVRSGCSVSCTRGARCQS